MSKSSDKGLYSGLLLDLPFLEGSGTITRDQAKPHHVDPTLVGTPSWITLANGLSVLDFDRPHLDYVRILDANKADLDFTTQDFTLCIWFYLHSTGGGRCDVICNQNLAFSAGYSISLTGLYGFAFSTFTSSDLYSPNNIFGLNEWHLITAVRNATSKNIYFDGRNVGTNACVDLNATSENMLFGIHVSLTYYAFDGYLWRPRIWNRALTNYEVNELFQSERHLFGV